MKGSMELTSKRTVTPRRCQGPVLRGQTASALRCRLITDPDGLGAVGESWDRLARQSEFVDVFATSGFAKAWWRAFGDTRLLRLVVVEEPCGLPRLIAPFYADVSAPQVWRLIGSFRADYTNLVSVEGDREGLRCLFGWLRDHGDWQIIHLENIPGEALALRHFLSAYEPESSKLAKLRSWLAVGEPLVYRQWHASHPRIDAATLRSLGNLLEEKNYRKHVNWFRRQGDLCYRCLADAEEIKTRLPEFIALHMAEWASKGGVSLFQDRRNRDFYSYLVEEMADQNAIRLDLLTLNEKPVAMHFGFTWQGRISYYKPCYDPAVASHSPGKLLLAQVLRRALDERVEEVDLLYGLEDYKMQYASAIRQTGSLLIWRSRVDALLARWVKARNGKA